LPLSPLLLGPGHLVPIPVPRSSLKWLKFSPPPLYNLFSTRNETARAQLSSPQRDFTLLCLRLDRPSVFLAGTLGRRARTPLPPPAPSVRFASLKSILSQNVTRSPTPPETFVPPSRTALFTFWPYIFQIPSPLLLHSGFKPSIPNGPL